MAVADPGLMQRGGPLVNIYIDRGRPFVVTSDCEAAAVTACSVKKKLPFL